MNIRITGIFITLCFMNFCTAPDYELINKIFHHQKNPRIKAFLDTIAFAEGTFTPDGYRYMFTGKTFKSFKDHPRLVHTSTTWGSNLRSSAAGRYQFLIKTWDDIAPQINALDFSPTNQDRAALALIIQRQALPDILKGDIKSAIYKLNTIWAPFPGSPYQQPIKPLEQLLRIYQQQLAYYERIKAMVRN